MGSGKGAPAGGPVEGPAGEAAGQWWPLDQLRPLPGNPRSHSPAQVRRIADLVRRFGWGRSVVIRPDGTILAGHGAVLAARELGYQAVPVRVLDLDAKASREFALADNARTFGEDDDAEVQAILAGADDEFAALLGAEVEPGLEVEDVDVGQLDERVSEGQFSLTVRGPLRVQPDVLDRLREALERIEGVTVDGSWT